MNESSYDFKKGNDEFSFEFWSVSNKKSIKKIIEFQLIDLESNLYNVALVDVLQDGSTSDISVSNNDDLHKVLATVFHAVVYFLKVSPQSKVFIQGSTKSRVRLYQMAIAKYLEELEPKFDIWGLFNNELQFFEKGSNYESFIINLKYHERD